MVAGLFARLVAYFCRRFLGDLFRLTARCCRYFGVGFVGGLGGWVVWVGAYLVLWLVVAKLLLLLFYCGLRLWLWVLWHWFGVCGWLLSH